MEDDSMIQQYLLQVHCKLETAAELDSWERRFPLFYFNPGPFVLMLLSRKAMTTPSNLPLFFPSLSQLDPPLQSLLQG